MENYHIKDNEVYVSIPDRQTFLVMLRTYSFVYAEDFHDTIWVREPNVETYHQVDSTLFEEIINLDVFTEETH
jgi:hypothetical protein